MCFEIFLALNAETKWVGYLSDLICRSSRDARRTRGSNYIKDERSDVCIRGQKKQEPGPVILYTRQQGKQSFPPVFFLLWQSQRNRGLWNRCSCSLLNQITLSSQRPELEGGSLEARRMKQKLIRPNKKRAASYLLIFWNFQTKEILTSGQSFLIMMYPFKKNKKSSSVFLYCLYFGVQNMMSFSSLPWLTYYLISSFCSPAS